jgi:hypothetical protein
MHRTRQCALGPQANFPQRLRATSPSGDFAQGLPRRAPRSVRALHRAIGMNRRSQKRNPTEGRKLDPNDPGELIGRRTGRGKAALGRVLSKPLSGRRDGYADTAEPDTSDTDRKLGGVATARRNAKVRAPRATAMLEDSRTKPSRKSTRRSANRVKAGQEQAKTHKLATHAPSARAQARRH